jgi:MFS family permease
MESAMSQADRGGTDPVPNPSAGALYPRPAVAWYAVCLIAFISTLSNIDRSVITLLVQPIKRDLLLSDTEISLLIGFAFSFFYMIFGLPMSRLTDVKPRKVILATGLTIWSIATVLCGLAQNFWQLFAARGLVGAGESVKGPNSMSLISDLVPREKFPRAFSIYQLGITGGMAASMIIGGVLIAAFDGMTIIVPGLGIIRDWQMVFFICGAPGVLVAIILMTTVPEPVRKGRKVKGSVPIRDVFRSSQATRRSTCLCC